MQKKLIFLSFVEGAAVMAAELCGAKLLAPIFGSSLYVWATVLGITLFALAAGYFSGGWLSSKQGNGIKILFQVLNAAALFLLLMPVVSHYLIPRISYLPFLPGVVAGTMILLFPPIYLLGASSPLFILLQSKETGDAGRVSGTVYAVSTLGGIVSTFLCGFYLIPQFGLQFSVFSFGLILFVANWIILKIFKPLHFFFFFALMYLNYQIYQSHPQALYTADGIMGKLVVEDLKESKRETRILKINEIIQTEMDLRNGQSISAYIRVLDSLIPRLEHNGKALVLGLGGGLSSNLLVQKKYSTKAVEFDQRIIDASINFFYLNNKVDFVCEDARRFMNKDSCVYDVILVDVFKAEEQPSYVITLESLSRLKRNLKPNSLLLINWHGYVQGNKGMGTAILYQTLIQSGFNVKLCSNSDLENQRNLIFVASISELGTLPFELDEKLKPTELVNTDDLPLLERYNAEANKTWRSLYLRHYQNSGTSF